MVVLMTKKVMNNARPVSTWFEGVVAMPSACRRIDSTMMMRVNAVIASRMRRQQRQHRHQDQHLERERIGLRAVGRRLDGDRRQRRLRDAAHGSRQHRQQQPQGDDPAAAMVARAASDSSPCCPAAS